MKKLFIYRFEFLFKYDFLVNSFSFFFVTF